MTGASAREYHGNVHASDRVPDFVGPIGEMAMCERVDRLLSHLSDDQIRDYLSRLPGARRSDLSLVSSTEMNKLFDDLIMEAVDRGIIES